MSYYNQLDRIEEAAREANRTGKVININGINFHPDPPRNKWADIGWMIYLFAGVLLCVFFSSAFYVVFLMWEQKP